MPFSESLAKEVRTALKGKRNISEKKMFGGLAFLLHGKMFCGVSGEELMVRVGPEAYLQALSKPHTRLMDFTGKPMTGYVFVTAKGLKTQQTVAGWVRNGLDFVNTLIREANKPAKPRPASSGRPRHPKSANADGKTSRARKIRTASPA